MRKQQGIKLYLCSAVLLLIGGALMYTPAGRAQSPEQTTNGACTQTWHLAPVESASDYTYLNGVAAISPTDVWAVGGSGVYGGSLIPWTVHWDGNSWQTVALANVPTATHVLNAVAAAGPADVWAVGEAAGKTLIMHWDGTSWRIVPSPSSQRAPVSSLHGVAVVNPNNVWAVGWIADGTLTEPYVLHWDGTRWQEQAVVSPSGNGAQFNAVTIVGPNEVWAVGSYTDERGNGTLIEQWNGTAWNILPNAGGVGPRSYSSLQAVAASGSHDVWAAGFITTPNTFPYNNLSSATLIQHWNGTTWQAVPSPNPGLSGGGLSGLSVLSPDDAWAVGGYVSDAPRPDIPRSKSLILHWDGVAWTQVDSPNTDSTRNDLSAVAALDANRLWAVGDANVPHTALIAEYSDRCVTPTLTRTATATWTPSPTFAPPPSTSGPLPLPTNTPVLPPPAGGPPTGRVPDPHLPSVLYFPIVGHSLQGGFRVYWETHGGLDQFGYPITEEFHEYDPAKGTDTTVQYFERARLEWHPENRPPYDILLGLLGRTVIAGRENEAPFQPQPVPFPPTWRYFAETGHVIAPELATYWETHGGLPIYGYPISNPFTEVNQADGKPYLVQYFERNRLEYHPELPDPYRVSLGLLGTEILRRQGWVP